MNTIGTIDISQLNSPPEKAEFETAKYFANLRNTKLAEAKSIHKLELEFKLNSQLKKLYIIRKDCTLLSYKK